MHQQQLKLGVHATSCKRFRGDQPRPQIGLVPHELCLSGPTPRTLEAETMLSETSNISTWKLYLHQTVNPEC